MDDTDELDPEQRFAMDTLSPYTATIDAAMRAAVQRFNDDTAARSIAGYDVRAICSAISCNIWNIMSDELGEDPGIHFLEIGGNLKVLNVSDKLVIRFKKVDDNGRHRNSQTRQQKQFDAQLPLEGIPDPALRLILGYQPDDAFVAVERITMRSPKSSWVSQIVQLDGAADWEDITPRRLGLEYPYRKQAPRRSTR